MNINTDPTKYNDPWDLRAFRRPLGKKATRTNYTLESCWCNCLKMPSGRAASFTRIAQGAAQILWGRLCKSKLRNQGVRKSFRGRGNENEVDHEVQHFFHTKLLCLCLCYRVVDSMQVLWLGLSEIMLYRLCRKNQTEPRKGILSCSSERSSPEKEKTQSRQVSQMGRKTESVEVLAWRHKICAAVFSYLYDYVWIYAE